MYYVEFNDNNKLQAPYASDFYTPNKEMIKTLTTDEVYKAYAVDTKINKMIFPEVHFDIYIVKKHYRNQQKEKVTEILLRTINSDLEILDSLIIGNSNTDQLCEGELFKNLKVTVTCNKQTETYSIDKKTGQFIKV